MKPINLREIAMVFAKAILPFCFYFTAGNAVMFVALAFGVLDQFVFGTIGLMAGIIIGYIIHHFTIYRFTEKLHNKIHDFHQELLEKAVNPPSGDEWKGN